MRARFVHSGDQQPDAVRPLTVDLRACLRAVADLVDEALEGDWSRIGHFGGEGLLFHEIGEDAGVGGEAGKGDAEVGVYGEDFLLVGGEFFGVALGLVGLAALFCVRVEEGEGGEL